MTTQSSLATSTHPGNAAAPPSAVDSFLKRYSTPIAAALATAVGITGVMMFFHVYQKEVESMHEWLGLAFVGAVALHLLRHRQPFAWLLAQRRTHALFALTALIAAAFLFFSPAKDESPVKGTVNAVLQAPLKDVVPIFGLTTEGALSRLSQAGVQNPSASQSLSGLARANRTSPIKLLAALGGKSAMPRDRPE